MFAAKASGNPESARRWFRSRCERSGAQPPSVREGASDVGLQRRRGRPTGLFAAKLVLDVRHSAGGSAANQLRRDDVAGGWDGFHSRR